MVRTRGTDSARVVSVIETQALRGSGTERDKCRIVTQYWDFDGNLLAENDPCAKEKEQFPTQFSFSLVVWLDRCQLYQHIPDNNRTNQQVQPASHSLKRGGGFATYFYCKH